MLDTYGFWQKGLYYILHLLLYGTSFAKVISYFPVILTFQYCESSEGASTTYFNILFLRQLVRARFKLKTSRMLSESATTKLLQPVFRYQFTSLYLLFLENKYCHTLTKRVVNQSKFIIPIHSSADILYSHTHRNIAQQTSSAFFQLHLLFVILLIILFTPCRKRHA
jgi:hypothetical protein